MILVCTCFTILTGAAAGGGGGGGGGGSTRKVISCCLGRASVKIRGISTIKPINPISRMIAKVVVRPRFVLSLPPDSRRLSSNMRFLLRQSLRKLRHRRRPLCSQIQRLASLAPQKSRQVRNALQLSTNTRLTQNQPHRYRAITCPGRALRPPCLLLLIRQSW